MAGNYKVMTADGRDISAECFVLRPQDRFAAAAVAAYCQGVQEGLCTLKATWPGLRRKRDQSAMADRAMRLAEHLDACRQIKRRFYEVVDAGLTKLPD